MLASVCYVTRSSRPLLSKVGLAILIFKAGRVKFKELMYLISVAGLGRDNLGDKFSGKKKKEPPRLLVSIGKKSKFRDSVK